MDGAGAVAAVLQTDHEDLPSLLGQARGCVFRVVFNTDQATIVSILSTATDRDSGTIAKREISCPCVLWDSVVCSDRARSVRFCGAVHKVVGIYFVL